MSMSPADQHVLSRVCDDNFSVWRNKIMFLQELRRAPCIVGFSAYGDRATPAELLHQLPIFLQEFDLALHARVMPASACATFKTHRQHGYIHVGTSCRAFLNGEETSVLKW